jgi:hypothetical protein
LSKSDKDLRLGAVWSFKVRSIVDRVVKDSILLNHDLSRFDHGCDRIALLELQLVSAAARDGTFDEVVANPNHDVRHDIAELNFLDFPAQFVAS